MHIGRAPESELLPDPPVIEKPAEDIAISAW
jgi:hypothetical protein